MTNKIGYDSRKNFIIGIKLLLEYHCNNIARLITYISIISTSIFNYDIFGFFYKTPDSVNVSFFINGLIIVIPASVYLGREAKKKIIMETKHRKIISWGYPILAMMIIMTELVFFDIHWISEGTHEFGITLPVDIKNQISLAMILAIFWLPMAEAIGFHSKELHEWICGRDRYIDDVECN